MIIESVEISNFRNYENLDIHLGEGVHIFYGDNAQGKSNFLEAVYLCALLKSYRGAKDKEMIRFLNEEGHIKLFLLKNGIRHRIDIHLKKIGNKGIAYDGVPKKNREYLGNLNCVMFSPEDLQIVKNGPQERRNFLDSELCMLDPIYMDSLSKYKKVLEQRNQLLKDIPFEPSLRDTLEMWDRHLVDYGRQIILRREEFIREICPIVQKIHNEITGNRESLSVYYEPDVAADELESELRNGRERDLKTKTTGTGPHRDDFSFILKDESKHESESGIDARVYGSQGQQRTSALSLKLAEIELVKKKTGEVPILLLDDVLSELDSGRQRYLIEKLRDIQTLITCTGLDEFVNRQIENSKIYHVVNGVITYGE